MTTPLLPGADDHDRRVAAQLPIVVGTDGSPESARGVRFAAQLALTLGAEQPQHVDDDHVTAEGERQLRGEPNAAGGLR